MPEVNRSVVALLGADRLEVPPKKRGLPVPCRGVEVAQAGVAILTYVFALWQLRDSGIVALEPVEKNRRLMPDDLRLRVQLTGSDPQRENSLEWAIVKRLNDKQNFKDIRGMIERTGFNHLDPWEHIVRIVLDDAQAAGLGTLQVPKLIKRLRGPAIFLEGDCERIAALAPEIDRTIADWKRVGEEDTLLRNALIHDVKRGIQNRYQPPVQTST
jgi:hypothetical protein